VNQLCLKLKAADSVSVCLIRNLRQSPDLACGSASAPLSQDSVCVRLGNLHLQPGQQRLAFRLQSSGSLSGRACLLILAVCRQRFRQERLRQCFVVAALLGFKFDCCLPRQTSSVRSVSFIEVHARQRHLFRSCSGCVTIAREKVQDRLVLAARASQIVAIAQNLGRVEHRLWPGRLFGWKSVRHFQHRRHL